MLLQACLFHGLCPTMAWLQKYTFDQNTIKKGDRTMVRTDKGLNKDYYSLIKEDMITLKLPTLEHFRNLKCSNMFSFIGCSF